MKKVKLPHGAGEWMWDAAPGGSGWSKTLPRTSAGRGTGDTPFTCPSLYCTVSFWRWSVWPLVLAVPRPSPHPWKVPATSTQPVWWTRVEEATSGPRKRGKPRARQFCLMGWLACFPISLSPLVRRFLLLNIRFLLHSLSSWKTPGLPPHVATSQSRFTAWLHGLTKEADESRRLHS